MNNSFSKDHRTAGWPSDLGVLNIYILYIYICIITYTWQKSKMTKWATQMLKKVHVYSFIINLNSRHWQIKYFSHLKHQLAFVIKVLSQAKIKKENTKWVNSKYIQYMQNYTFWIMWKGFGWYMYICRWLRCNKKLSYNNHIGNNRHISEIVCHDTVLAHLIMLVHLKLYM